tara:strand:+ start:932 stop:1714 length:783 start_codon:yes stop_codon:yes gene_type:complete
MKKIRNKTICVSPGICKDGKLELLDIEFLKEAGSRFAGYIPEEESIRKTFPDDVHFFYTIENFDGKGQETRTLVQAERGLGRVVKQRKRFFLERVTLIESHDQTSDTPVDEDGFFVFPEDEYLVVNSFIPLHYAQTLIFENSVICSSESFTPYPVQIQENSVLGRTDGDVESISSEELALILTTDFAVDSLQSNSRPLLLGSDHVEVTNPKTKLVSSHLVVKPRDGRPRNRQAGTIVFNSKKNCLEFFDGVEWKKIETEK